MANSLGILEVTLAKAADSGDACNVLAPAGSDPKTSRLHPWQGLTVRILDHDDDDNTEQDNAEKMAIFHSSCLGAPWKKYRGGNRSNIVRNTGDGSIPSDVTVLYPDFDYNDPQWAPL